MGRASRSCPIVRCTRIERSVVLRSLSKPVRDLGRALGPIEKVETMRRVLAGLAAVFAMVFMGASAANAGVYPPGSDPLILSATTVVAGQPFTVTLTDCALGETVEFTVSGSSDSETCGGAGGGDTRFLQAPGTGTATGTLTAPSTPGEYTVSATGLTSGRSATATITVVAAGAGTGDDDGAGAGGLPATGSDTTATTLWVAGGALLAGLGLTGVAMYRRRRPVAA